MEITHLSYSQYNSYTQCPRSWYLGKVRGAEERQAWYTAVGTAVHHMIEEYLKGVNDTPSAPEFFYPVIARQMEIEPDLSKWLAGGSQEAPVTEEKALQQVVDCFEKALEFLDDIDVWEVEFDASGRLPGLEVQIKAYIDIVGEHKKHGPTIVDWKTGSQKPKTNFQLETYKPLWDVLDLGEPIKTGLWAMLKPGASKARPVDLSAVDPAEVGAKYQEVYEKMKQELYPTNHGFNCRFCFQAPNCILESGPTARAVYFDQAHEDGFPF